MATKKKLAVYLAGPIENARDGGIGWRKELTPFIESLDIEVLDPCALEADKLRHFRPNRLPESYTDLFGNKRKPVKWYDLKNAKEPHLLERFMVLMKTIIDYDLRLITRRADFVIALWNEPSFGTASELTVAHTEGLEVYMVAKSEIPAWVRGCVTKVFLSFDDLKAFLSEQYVDETTESTK